MSKLSMTGASPVTTILRLRVASHAVAQSTVVTGLAPVMLHIPVMTLAATDVTGNVYA